MKNFFNKMTAKAMCKTVEVKRTIVTTIRNHDGMEVVQVLVVVIISITLGALLLSTLKGQFTSLLGTVSTEMNNLFPATT